MMEPESIKVNNLRCVEPERLGEAHLNTMYEAMGYIHRCHPVYTSAGSSGSRCQNFQRLLRHALLSSGILVSSDCNIREVQIPEGQVSPSSTLIRYDHRCSLLEWAVVKCKQPITREYGARAASRALERAMVSHQHSAEHPTSATAVNMAHRSVHLTDSTNFHACARKSKSW